MAAEFEKSETSIEEKAREKLVKFLKTEDIDTKKDDSLIPTEMARQAVVYDRIAELHTQATLDRARIDAARTSDREENASILRVAEQRAAVLPSLITHHLGTIPGYPQARAELAKHEDTIFEAINRFGHHNADETVVRRNELEQAAKKAFVKKK